MRVWVQCRRRVVWPVNGVNEHPLDGHDRKVHPVDCPAREDGAENCNTQTHANITRWVSGLVSRPVQVHPREEPVQT